MIFNFNKGTLMARRNSVFTKCDSFHEIVRKVTLHFNNPDWESYRRVNNNISKYSGYVFKNKNPKALFDLAYFLSLISDLSFQSEEYILSIRSFKQIRKDIDLYFKYPKCFKSSKYPFNIVNNLDYFRKSESHWWNNKDSYLELVETYKTIPQILINILIELEERIEDIDIKQKLFFAVGEYPLCWDTFKEYLLELDDEKFESDFDFSILSFEEFQKHGQEEYDRALMYETRIKKRTLT
jgi:hypothetical protein